MSRGERVRAALTALVDRGHLAGAAVFYVVVALAYTWPAARDPARVGVPNGDYYINTWVLSWVVHQLGTAPTRLFEANIFFPSSTSLAYNEMLLPQALTAAPVFLLGGGPVLAHNFAFFLTFPLSALAAYVLALDLFKSRGGALLAGLGFGFCAFRFNWINNIQCSSTQWLPLAMLCTLRVLRADDRWSRIGLFLCALAQALSSGYFALLLPIALGIVLLHGLGERPAWRRVGEAVAMLVLAALGAFLAALPYAALSRREGLTRGMDELVHWSATFGSFLDPGRFSGWPHHLLLRRLHDWGDPLFPGTVVLLLAVAGLVCARHHRGARLSLWLGLAGALLALGPEVHLGPWTLPGPFLGLRALPLGGMVRTPVRLGILAILGLDLLAAAGWAWVVERRPRLRALAPVLAVLMAVEAYPFGMDRSFGRVPPPTAASRWLAAAPRGPVLELPWNEHNDSTLYMYWSTVHWQHLVNGAGSFDARGQYGLGLMGDRFPTPFTRNAYAAWGIEYVVVHLDRLTPAQRLRLETREIPSGVVEAARLGSDRVYRIERGGTP